MFGKFNKTEEYSPCAADCQPCRDEGTLGSPARSMAGCEGLGTAAARGACSLCECERLACVRKSNYFHLCMFNEDFKGI